MFYGCGLLTFLYRNFDNQMVRVSLISLVQCSSVNKCLNFSGLVKLYISVDINNFHTIIYE